MTHSSRLCRGRPDRTNRPQTLQALRQGFRSRIGDDLSHRDSPFRYHDTPPSFHRANDLAQTRLGVVDRVGCGCHANNIFDLARLVKFLGRRRRADSGWARPVPLQHTPLAAAHSPGALCPPVQDLDPGLHILVRDPTQTAALRTQMRPEFAWEKPEACPDGLDLYRLQAADTRDLAKRVSCFQSIAADGCLGLGMIAEFERPLQQYGAWFYPRLFWESGVIGQILYLEAEAIGIRGTGIGCFFDDPMHFVLGLETLQYQSLYHFTMGGLIEDPRLKSLPPYASKA